MTGLVRLFCENHQVYVQHESGAYVARYMELHIMTSPQRPPWMGCKITNPDRSQPKMEEKTQ